MSALGRLRRALPKAAALFTALTGASGCYGDAGYATPADGFYDDGAAYSEPPPSVIVTTEPYYYDGRPTYWYGNRWHYRDGGRWNHYDTEPAPLRQYRANGGGWRGSPASGGWRGSPAGRPPGSGAWRGSPAAGRSARWR